MQYVLLFIMYFVNILIILNEPLIWVRNDLEREKKNNVHVYLKRIICRLDQEKRSDVKLYSNKNQYFIHGPNGQ